MKKLLTFVLALVALAVLVGPGVAQQALQERPTRTPRVSQMFAQPIVRLAGLEGRVNPAPQKKCTCVASKGGWNSGIVHNYGVIATYGLLDVNAPGKCSKKCSDLVSGRSSIENATAVCASTNWSGGCVRGYGYIGAIGTNNADGTAGKLICNAPVAAVTQQKCPAGWVCNGCSPQVDGGVTSDGKCKKLACQANSIAPYPADGTQIGSWGFSWGNAFYAWGTSANGGKPILNIISPAIPGSGSWGSCP
ncbi:MAG: hypothetical protein WAM70_16800 [Pyrinomonadaceae bacterium]